MRLTVEHSVPIIEKKDLDWDKFNRPIARLPTSIQGSAPVRSVGGLLSPSSPISPTNVLITKTLQSNTNSLRPKESPHSPKATIYKSNEQGPKNQPHSRISTPRQPKPKLNVRVPEISPRFSELSSNNSDCTNYKASTRRVSWSPSQAIPEGHYSKGFTLTTFQKTVDKAISTSSSSSSSSSSNPNYSALNPASASLKRANTNNLQRKETLTPFRRFVGRSKSMRVKTPGPFVITETDNKLRAERFNAFYNDEKENSTPKSDKPSDMFNTKFKDRNSPGDPESHSNGIQSQERLGGRKVVSESRKETIPTTSNMAQTSSSFKPIIASISNGPCKPLWQHTMTNAEQIRVLGLSTQEVQKQETIFELIYTESEYLDDLKTIHKIFVEELNVKMAESRRKKRFSPEKSDVKLYERFARLSSHIKDLWNGHQSLLRELLKSPRCKNLTLEGIFLKPIQRLQKYPLFFKDLMNLTSKSDPDYPQLEHALSNHQKELTKIDDRIWIEEHNEMLTDLQQRIKGLPSMDQYIGSLCDSPAKYK
ncbi:Intersectin 1 (SH3 domain protein) [Haplosporangium sp. Z 27]|nr:Intersectin 1 (SH3 domain protein) [Haplosporangium sp. Z 27]